MVFRIYFRCEGRRYGGGFARAVLIRFQAAVQYGGKTQSHRNLPFSLASARRHNL